MAAEVDFGDRELFEQLDGEDGPPPPRLGPEEEEEEEEGPGGALAELRERLQGCEETVRRLRAENILTGTAGPAPGRGPAPPEGRRGGSSHPSFLWSFLGFCSDFYPQDTRLYTSGTSLGRGGS